MGRQRLQSPVARTEKGHRISPAPDAVARSVAARVRAALLLVGLLAAGVVGLLSTGAVAREQNQVAQQQTEPEESQIAADVDLGQVEVGEQISYTPPTLSPDKAQSCLIGAGILWKRVGDDDVVTRSDNGFSLSYSHGEPRLAGKAKFPAAPTLYRIEYICGFPSSWSGSYTISVEVIGAGMSFGSDSLGRRTLYKDQQRTINPPQLFEAEGTVTYAVSPSLPAGLSLDTATGVISGTPTALQGRVTYTVSATDSKTGSAQTASFTLDLSVVLGMRWSVSSIPDQVYEEGERIEFVPPALVNPVSRLQYSYRASHDGLLYMHPYSGRLLASRATPMVKNTYTITAFDRDRYSDRSPQRVSISVNIETQAVHRLGAGQTVSIPAMTLPGLTGTITYALASTPALPSGLSFDSSTGEISGTLDAAGTQAKQTYTITGTDENSKSVDYRFKIEVRKLSTTGTNASYEVKAGYPLSIAPTTSGGFGAVTYSLSPDGVKLPDGLSFSAITGAITGTPKTEFGKRTYTVTATDSADTPQTASYTVEVAAIPSKRSPRLTITGDSSVTEGGTATFTFHAAPPADPEIDVLYLLTTNAQQQFIDPRRLKFQFKLVTISGASTMVSIPTLSNDRYEADGWVTFTIAPNTTKDYGSYSRGKPGSHTVTIKNDDPKVVTPQVNITSSAGGTEGDNVSFTITATPAPTSALAVKTTVSAVGDFGVTTGARTNIIPTSGSTTLTVSTTDDATDEENGSVTLTLNAGTGYTVGQQSSVTAEVLDNDNAPLIITPGVSVTAGSAITEGDDATFTVMASPSPSSALSVSVTVSQDGEFGATTGARTVTIPTSGTATLALSTTDDSADEPNGSVSVAVDSGSGYTVSSIQDSASVSVADNDDQLKLVVSITAGSGITEGGNATFTVTATPAPSSPLSVSVNVTQQGDFGATTGSRTVTVPTSGSTTVTVGTTEDSEEEQNGSVSVTVNSGSGYSVSVTKGSASVSVIDNDDPPPTNLPQVSVTDATAIEGATGFLTLLEFTITLSAASDENVTVDYELLGGSAISGLDFWGGSGRATIWAGRTRGTIGFNVRDDNRRESDETLIIELTGADGAVIASRASTATGTIIDND